MSNLNHDFLPKLSRPTLGLACFFVAWSVFRFTAAADFLDRGVYRFADDMSWSGWLPFWRGATVLGEGFFVYPLLAILILPKMFRNPSRQSLQAVLLVVFSFLINPLLKLVFALDRPVPLSPSVASLGTHTYPSGHAFNSAVLAFLLPVLLPKIKKKIGEKYLWLSWFYIALICASRVFLGAHWLSDVIGGAALGMVVVGFLRQELSFTDSER